MICSFLTDDNIYNYISNMGNNLTLQNIAIGMQNIYFSTPHLKYIKEGKINHDKLLEWNDNSSDLYYYCISQCGKDSFKN